MSLENPQRTWTMVGIALMTAAVSIRAVFWIYTRRIWEDALITVLHSENAGRGLGLTLYKLDGRPVHGFTSPISVLVPLMADLLHPGAGLSFIRCVSLVAAAATVLVALRIARHPSFSLRLPFAILAAGYLAFEHHQILWGMAGMETQLATLALLFSVYCFLRRSPYWLGISLGLALYARPDFLWWDLVCGGALLLETIRLKQPRLLVRSAILAAAVYAPWLAFTVWYYGSPIPNTVIAKSAGLPLWWTVAPSLAYLGRRFLSLFAAMGPGFGGHGTMFIFFADRGAIFLLMLGVLWTGLYFAVRRHKLDILTLYAYGLVYLVYHIFLIPVTYGWYRVPVAGLMMVLCAWSAQQIADLIAEPWRGRIGAAFVAAYLAIIVAVLPITFRAERNIQLLVEDQVRKPLGLYLARIMKPGQTVGCEPLGYIAYYSGRTVYDYPGLANSRVTQYVRTHPEGRSLDRMLDHFRPDYLVLRGFEYEGFLHNSADGWLKTDYVPVREFAVPAADIAKLFHPEANNDLVFWVLRRREPGE